MAGARNLMYERQKTAELPINILNILIVNFYFEKKKCILVANLVEKAKGKDKMRGVANF